MKLKHKILFTSGNILASWLIIWNLESGSVGLAFILICLLTMFNGAVIDIAEDVE